MTASEQAPLLFPGLSPKSGSGLSGISEGLGSVYRTSKGSTDLSRTSEGLVSPCRKASRTVSLDPDGIAVIRKTTGLKADLQGRMLMTMFEVAKISFENARKRKTWWFTALPNFLQAWVIKSDAPNLYDFARAYALFHDWYPQLEAEVRVSQDVFKMCSADILVSMKELIIDGRIGAHDEQDNNFFMDWIEETLQTDASPDMEQDFPANQLCSQEDPKIDHVRQNLQAMHALLCGDQATTVGSAMDTFLPFLRVAWIILTIFVLFLYEACGLGMGTQMVFKLNMAVSTGESSFCELLWRNRYLPFVPVWTFLFAILGAEAAELAGDAMQFPPFKRARASLIIMLSHLSWKSVLEGKIDKRTLMLVDLFLVHAFVISTVLGLLLSCVRRIVHGKELWHCALLQGLSEGALAWTVAFVILFASSRLYNRIFLVLWAEHSFGKKGDGGNMLMRCINDLYKKVGGDEVKIVFKPSRCDKVIREALATYAIMPGETWKYFLPLQRILEIYRYDDYAWQQKVPEWHEWQQKVDGWKEGLSDDKSYTAFRKKVSQHDTILQAATVGSQVRWFTLPLVGWILTLVVCFALRHTSAQDPSYNDNQEIEFHHVFWLWVVIVVGNVGMMITLWGISRAVKWTLPLFANRKSFRIHLTGFVAFMVFFSVVSAYAFRPESMCHPIMTVHSEREDHKGVFYNDGANNSLAIPYAACRMHWGSPNHPVRILDLGAMSVYSYENEEANFNKLLTQSFKNTTSIHWDEKGALPRIVAARLCGSDKSDKNEQCTIIVAVRGTTSKLEVMSDVGFFGTVVVMQMLDKIAPMIGTLPVQLISGVLDFAQLHSFHRTQEIFLWRIKEVIANITKTYTKDTLVITGHSLGGNFAEVTGARLRIPAVGFSSPGQYYLMDSFGVDRRSIRRNVMTIWPSSDMVPKVGGHVDMVQRINCLNENGTRYSSLQCHSSELATCELWRVCGDVEQRSFSYCLKGKVREDCVGRAFEDCLDL